MKGRCGSGIPPPANPLARPLSVTGGWVNALTCGFLGKTAVAVSVSDDVRSGSGISTPASRTENPWFTSPTKRYDRWVSRVAVGKLEYRTAHRFRGAQRRSQRSGIPRQAGRSGDPLRGHRAGDPSIGDFRYVTAVDFGYVNGQPRVVTGGNDATVRLWDPQT